MKNIAHKKNGMCLSRTYINAKHKLTWKCHDGHIWEATPDNIQSERWCPHCNINLTEEKCRFIFESLLGKEFPRINRILGDRYQLDGYCQDIGLAFEYNGMQHYKIVKAWDSPKSFKESQKTDAKKSSLCKKQGIVKIDIPYTKSKTDKMLCDYIKQELLKNQIRFNGILDWSNFQPYKSKLTQLRNTIGSRGITCLSQYYPGTSHKALFKCVKCYYSWEAKIDHVERGGGCPQCAGKVQNIEKMQKLAASKLGMCLSLAYVNTSTHLEWMCRHGHTWLARPHNVKCGQWCPECAKTKRWETRRQNKCSG